MKKLLPALLLPLLLAACKQKDYNAGLLGKNAQVYTVDNNFSTAGAFAVKGGKILAVGTTDDLEKQYNAHEVVDAGGKAVYPGFIDAHAHFLEYGIALQQVNLVGTKSWPEIVDTVLSFSKLNPDGWLIGRGWDQNKWTVKQFPTKGKLDSLFPARPVILTRIDGHAAIANQAALNIAAIKPGQTIPGGEIETVKGKLTGILVDNAVGLVSHHIPPPTEDQATNGVMMAQGNCFAVGLTTVDDCGMDYSVRSEERRVGK